MEEERDGGRKEVWMEGGRAGGRERWRGGREDILNLFR